LLHAGDLFGSIFRLEELFLMISNTKAITASSYLSMFFLGVSMSLVGAAAQSIGLTPYQIGLFLAAQNVGFTISVVASGAWADTYSKPRILLAGSVLLALAFFTFYISENFWINLVIMFFIGAGAATYEGVTDAMLLEIHTQRQSLHINVNHFFVTFGSIMIAVYLTYLELNWRNSLVQSGVIVLLLALFFAFTRLKNQQKQAEPYIQRLKILTRDRVAVILFVAAVLAVGVETGTIGILSTFLADMRGFSAFTANGGLIIFLMGMAIGRLLVGFLSRNEQLVQITIGLFGLGFVVYLVLFLIDFGALTYIAVFVAGLALSALLPLMLTIAGLLYPEIAGTVLGALKVAIPVGGMVLPFLMAIVAGQFSLQVALMIFPVAFLLGFGLLLSSMQLFQTVGKPVSTS
jgi:FHS family glucose/mannose:H+ symporter-like MFS transporter